MEKGYLDTMIFGLSSDQAQTELVEQFQYRFAYDANGISIADSFGTETAILLSSSQVSPCMSQLHSQQRWCATASFCQCSRILPSHVSLQLHARSCGKCAAGSTFHVQQAEDGL